MVAVELHAVHTAWIGSLSMACSPCPFCCNAQNVRREAIVGKARVREASHKMGQQRPETK